MTDVRVHYGFEEGRTRWGTPPQVRHRHGVRGGTAMTLTPADLPHRFFLSPERLSSGCDQDRWRYRWQ
jgi:hypothetical protein